MIAVALVALITGVVSGLAIGGGSLLVPALVFIFAVPQHRAQGIVLLSFLPIAAVAAVTHYRQGFVALPAVWRLAVFAAAGALVGANFAAMIPAESLRRIFGLYLLAMAGYTFFTPDPKRSVGDRKQD